jgi:hypothetical protein
MIIHGISRHAVRGEGDLPELPVLNNKAENGGALSATT